MGIEELVGVISVQVLLEGRDMRGLSEVSGNKADALFC